MSDRQQPRQPSGLSTGGRYATFKGSGASSGVKALLVHGKLEPADLAEFAGRAGIVDERYAIDGQPKFVLDGRVIQGAAVRKVGGAAAAAQVPMADGRRLSIVWSPGSGSDNVWYNHEFIDRPSTVEVAVVLPRQGSLDRSVNAGQPYRHVPVSVVAALVERIQSGEFDGDFDCLEREPIE